MNKEKSFGSLPNPLLQNKLEQIVSELESKQDVEQKCMSTTLTISYLLFSVAVIYILAKLTI